MVNSSHVFNIFGLGMHHNKFIPVSIYYVMPFPYSIYTGAFDHILCDMTLAAITI